MNCKFCNAELAEEVTLCPQCGKENLEEVTEEVMEEVTEEVAEEVTDRAEEEFTEETDAEETSEETPVEAPKKKPSLWVTILAVVGGIALVAVLAAAVYFGFFKDKAAVKTTSYTVSESKAVKARDTVVAVAGSRELTNSELQVYYWQCINDFYNYYGYYMDLSTLGLDLSQPLDQQFYDEANGITWQQYFLDMALNTWHRYASLGQTAEAEGYEMDTEQKAYLESIPTELEAMAVAYGYTSAEDMLKQDMGPACNLDGYMRFLELNYYVGQYYDKVYLELEPTDEELESYYAENEDAVLAMGIEKNDSKYVDVRHILIKPEGTLDAETGELVYSEADWEACRQEAQDLLDQWKAGEATEESFGSLAATYSEDAGSQSLGGLYTDMYEGQMVEPFEDWCFDESRVYGDTGLVQTTYGYHIIFFIDSEPMWLANLRTQLVTDRSNAFVENAIANTPSTVYQDKIVLTEALSAE